MDINLDTHIEGFTLRDLYNYVWATMCSFLKVSAQQKLTTDPSHEKLPMTVLFTVSNEAPQGSNLPEITYNEIQLNFGIPPDWKVEHIPNLTAGQSHQFEYLCNFSDVSKIQYHVAGKITPTLIMQVTNEPKLVSGNWSPQTIPEYFRIIEVIGINQWLEKKIPNVVVPNSNTTLGEVKELQKNFSKCFEEIEQTKNILQAATPDLPLANNKRDRFLQLRNQIIEYLNLTARQCTPIANALRTPDARKIEAEKKHAIERLSKEAAIIDKAIADFKNSINV